jgi:beta-lactamase superfamily II metal-dependent hydrolase
MYLKYHRAYFPDDVLVYIEEFNKAEGYILFDFYDSNEYERFSSYLNNDFDINDATMISLENYQYRTIRENTYYSIKRETIDSWQENNSITRNEDSLLIGYTINVSNINLETQIFTHSVSLNDYDSFNHLMYGDSDVTDIDFDLSGTLTVNIKNVGQGNWNEIIKDESCVIVYDCGTSMVASKTDVRLLINTRSKHYIKNKPSLFLSHWDKDHYHCLIGMTDVELASFSNFVFRDNVPNLTSRKLYSRIRSLISVKNLYAIPADRRTSRGGMTLLRPLNNTNNQLVIYNAQYHKDRNISGILLSLKNANSSVIFSGDSHYSQVSTCVLPHLNFPNKHYLIVPHHGGKGGNYEYDNPGKIVFESAIISVGRNRYGHPKPHYVSALKADFRTITKTSLTKNDITINL